MNAAPVPRLDPRIPSLRIRARTVVQTLGTLVRDPNRLDQVLVLSQAVNLGTIVRAASRLVESAEGRALLDEQPRIDRDHVDFDALERLPDGTLGREYIRFLHDNAITPDVFAELPDVGDTRAAYLMLRMRQTHDLWHVLTGFSADLRGEILLQAFTYAQTGAPSAFMLTFVGTVRYRYPGQTKEVREAFQRGKRAGFLPTFRWEDHWATPVAELRERLTCPAESASSASTAQ